jgi:hypothetical protein
MTKPGDRHHLSPPRTSSGYALPSSFWSMFRETHWESVGAVLQQPFAAPITTPDESFACLVAASDRYRAGDHSVKLEFCIEHAQVLAEVGRLLPEGADRTAAGYAARVTPLIGGRRFGLVVEDVQAFDASLWLRLREFLRGLFEQTGLPGDACKATVFLGNYDRTPFGLHRGDSANFMFVVEGEKRMRTWPDAFFRDKENLTHRLDYERYNDDSIVMDAGPGDVIFWPSDYWHIGESVSGGLSSAVSVALFMTPRPAANVIAHVAPIVHAHMTGDAPTASLGAHLGPLERIALEATRARSALIAAASDARLEHALRVDLLNRVTAFGFERPPQPLPHRSLADVDVVRGNPCYPVLWMRDDDEDIICSACGHAFGTSASPHVIGLLAALNTGEPRRVGDLVEEFSGVAEDGDVVFETSPASARALLERLVRLRAIA